MFDARMLRSDFWGAFSRPRESLASRVDRVRRPEPSETVLGSMVEGCSPPGASGIEQSSSFLEARRLRTFFELSRGQEASKRAVSSIVGVRELRRAFFRAFSRLGRVDASPEASMIRAFSRPGGFEASRSEHVRRPDASQRASGSLLEASRRRK